MSNTATPNYLPQNSAFSCKSQTSYNLSDDPANPDYHWYKVVFTPTTNDGTAWSVSVTVADPTESFAASGLPLMPSSPP